MRYLAQLVITTSLFVAPAFAQSNESSKTTDRPFDLPTEEQIDEMLQEMPDFNGIIRDMVKLAKDDELKARMERSGEALAKKLDESGAFEPDEDGMPDVNKAIRVLMYALADEDVTGGMLDTIEDLQSIMEKHVMDDQPKTDSAPN